MNINPVRLTGDEVENIKAKNPCIGSGVDGIVYKINKNDVYKFYKNNDQIVIRNYAVYDSDGVNINDFKNLRNLGKRYDTRAIKYIDKDGVSLAREEAINKAIEKQEKVSMTRLPKNIIYVDNKVSGCVYQYYPNKLGIYASTYLPLKLKIRVCRKLLEKVKELLSNNIYPVTLAQKNDLFPFISNNSNVNYSATLYNNALSSLSSLIFEILTKVELSINTINDDEVDDYIERLVDKGISDYIVQKFFDYGSLDIDEIDYTIKKFEKKL